MEIPKEISDQTVKAAEEELRTLFESMLIVPTIVEWPEYIAKYTKDITKYTEEDKKYVERLKEMHKEELEARYSTIRALNLPKEYSPLALKDYTIIIPIKTTEQRCPLCVKFCGKSIESYTDQDYGRQGTRTSFFGIENNRKALIQLNLTQIIIPPQRIIQPREKVNGLLVPDLSNKKENKVTDLSDVIRKLQESNDQLVAVYQEVISKLKPFNIKFIGHGDARTRQGMLELCIQRMLFLIEEKDKKYLAAGDLDHFEINYGLCHHCNEEGPIIKTGNLDYGWG